MLLAGACGAQGAGLGKLSVFSGIGQQLNAEVALNATPAELASMSAKLASPEAFEEAGIEYMPVLSDLRIEIEKSATGEPVLKLTTARPVTEPFLHFLVELSWGSGRVVREYTFLLDPPEMLQVAKPASVVAPAAPAIKPLPTPAAVAPAAPAATMTKPTPSAGGGEYQVKSGDTLSKIARETRPESVTLDQMLVALFESNPEAFAGGNMNRLRAGKILRIPAADEVAKVDPAKARKLVINHTHEFSAYKRRLAAAAAAMPVVAAAPQQRASGTIKPQVEDKTPPPPAKDKLEVSRTEPAKAEPAAGGSSLEEELIARDKALREASERIALLEKNIENLQKLVEIKSQTGAALQQRSEATPTAAPVKPPEPAKSETLTPKKAEEPKPATAVEATAAKPAEPAESVPSAPSETARATKPATPPAAKKPVPPLTPEDEPSFVEENPALVYGGAGLIALLLGYLGYSTWRRKKATAESAVSAANAVATAAPNVPAATFESSEISIQGEFSEGMLPSSEVIVDPVAEAEVLMAYGRDRQAEEVLQAGLAKDPSRSAIHMKLLELYAKQKKLAQFEVVAKKLHDLGEKRGPDWEKVVAMAHSLGLFGGIFATGAAMAAASGSTVAADKIEPTSITLQLEPKAGQVSVAEAEASPEAAEVKEAASLEFDLDLGSPTPGEQAASEAAQTRTLAAPIQETDMALDFDFDLGSPEAEEAVAARVEKAEAGVAENPSALDFELDLGSPVEEAGAKPATAISESPLDIDFDFDLHPSTDSAAAAQAPVAGAPSAVAPVDATSLEVAPIPGLGDLKLDFDLELEEETPTDKLAIPPVAETQETIAVETAAAPAAPEQVEADNVEAATKLELAQAYEEMGDLEGARELLNEVLNEGSAAQQAQAKARLEQLSTSS